MSVAEAPALLHDEAAEPLLSGLYRSKLQRLLANATANRVMKRLPAPTARLSQGGLCYAMLVYLHVMLGLT